MTGGLQRVAAKGWGAHRTIGAAVRAAAPGEVVSIQAGTYVESARSAAPRSSGEPAGTK